MAMNAQTKTPPSRPKRLFLQLLSYFLRGVFLFLPAVVTIYVLRILLEWLDSIIPLEIPGLGILILVTVFILLGYLATHWIGPSVWQPIEERIRKIPFIGFIYGSVREIIDNSQQKNRFDKPVLIRVQDNPPMYQIGFLTNSAPIPGENLVAVYIPYALSFMGELRLVPHDAIRVLPAKGADALRFAMSGGFISLESLPEKSPSA
jgi:uncharacterized membrane protein